MKTFRTLDLAIEFHEQAINLKVNGHLRDQLLRAAASIPLKRFYQTAYGSVKECQTLFKMMKLTNEKVVATADHLGASIYKLINSKITEIIRPKNA